MKIYFALLLMLSTHVTALASEWSLEMDSDQVEIHSRHWDGDKFREIKGTTVVTASMRQLVSFLQDATINTQWVPYSGGATILERTSQYQAYVHFRIDAQWPFKNRDTVALFSISQDEKNNNVTITLESSPNKISEIENLIRIKHYSGSWKLIPINDTQIRVIYQSHLDPGGFIPAWLANKVAYKCTFTSLSNLKKQVTQYNNVSDLFLFINE